MTRDETKVILNRVFSLYMTQSRRLSVNEKTAMLDSWADMFGAESYDDVSRAVTMYARSGKQFLPNPSDIINELTAIEDMNAHGLFTQLARAAEMAANPVKHIVIDDLGGLRYSEAYGRDVYYPAEAHYTTDYTQADFAALPIELQEYAESIYGLKNIHNEICSNKAYARQRFIDRIGRIRKNNTEENNGKDKDY